MIIEGTLDLFFSLLEMAFSGLEAIYLPTQLINTLSTLMCYGVWVVGVDVLGYFVSAVVFWWTLKFTVGLVVWVWELLPLT